MSLIGNNQVGSLVAGGTTLTGVLAKWGITSDSMGLVAAIIGVLLSFVMLWGHVKRIINDSADRRERAKAAQLAEKKALLELDKLRREISKTAQ